MTAPNTPLGSFLEGLAGGAQQGYQFRTGIQDRKRRILSEDEQAQYERAKQLREAVGFQLQQRVLEKQLAKPNLVEVNRGASLVNTDTGQPVFTSPDTAGSPRNIDPNSPEGFTAWQQRYDYERAHPKPATGGGTLGGEAGKKNTLGRINAISAIKEAEALLKVDPNADYVPVSAEAAEGIGNFPVIGKALHGLTGAAQQKLLTPNQQKFRRLMDAMIHNTVGLLPGSRQSIALFNNVRDTYRPAAGASGESRAEARKLRLELARRMQQMQAGQEVTEGDLMALPPSDGAPPDTAGPAAPAVGPTAPRRAVNPRKFFRP